MQHEGLVAFLVDDVGVLIFAVVVHDMMAMAMVMVMKGWEGWVLREEQKESGVRQLSPFLRAFRKDDGRFW